MSPDKQDVIVTIADGPLNISAVVPETVKSTGKKVLVITRKPVWQEITACHLGGELDESYPVTYADEDAKSLDDFLKRMDMERVQVGIIDIKHPIFEKVINCAELWFAACRDGLVKTYLPLISDKVNAPIDIVSFDNDASIIELAKKQCSNPLIHFHKGVAHSVGVLEQFDCDNAIVRVSCGSECVFILPQSAKHYARDFHNDLLWGRAHWIFTETEEEFNLYACFKKICINGPHSMSAVYASIKGVEAGLSLKEVVNKKWNEVVPLEELLDFVLRIEDILYDKYLAESEHILQFDRELCRLMTTHFIEGLYKLPGETIGRALDPESATFKTKVEQHLTLLRSSADQEVSNLLDAYMKLI